MKSVLTILSLVFCTTLLHAQKSEIGLHLGLTNYLGDLVSSDISLKNPTLAYGLYYRNPINPKWTIKGGLTFGNFKGDDANFEERQNRGFSFKSFMTEISAVVEWNVLGKPKINEAGLFNKTSSPFLFAGLGGIITSPKVTGLPANAPENTGDFSKFSLIVPVGGGYKFDLSETTTLSVHYSFQLTFTDYLDGVSESANPDANDAYTMLGINLGYTFGKAKVGEDEVLD